MQLLFCFWRFFSMCLLSNAHVWVTTNPHATRPHAFQHRFSVTFWEGTVKDILIGLYPLPKWFNERCHQYFRRRFYQNCCWMFRQSYAINWRVNMMMHFPISIWMHTSFKGRWIVSLWTGPIVKFVDRRLLFMGASDDPHLADFSWLRWGTRCSTRHCGCVQEIVGILETVRYSLNAVQLVLLLVFVISSICCKHFCKGALYADVVSKLIFVSFFMCPVRVTATVTFLKKNVFYSSIFAPWFSKPTTISNHAVLLDHPKKIKPNYKLSFSLMPHETRNLKTFGRFQEPRSFEILCLGRFFHNNLEIEFPACYSASVFIKKILVARRNNSGLFLKSSY